MLVGIQGAVRGELNIVADVDATQRRRQVAASLDVRVPTNRDLSALDQFENRVTLDGGFRPDDSLPAIPMRKNSDIIIDKHAPSNLDSRAMNIRPGRHVASAAQVNQLAPRFVRTGQLAGELEEERSQHRQGGKD